MPIEIWIFAAIIGSASAAGVYLWSRTGSQLPCPHCDKRSSRTFIDEPAIAGLLRPRHLIYRCSECRGEMRYARRPNGQEFWEPIGAVPLEGS